MSCPFPLPEQRHIHSNPESQSPRTPESPSGWARTGVRVSWLAPPPFRHTLQTTHHPKGLLHSSRRQCAFFLVISNSGVTRTQRMIDREEGTRVWPERRPPSPAPANTGPGKDPPCLHN